MKLHLRFLWMLLGCFFTRKSCDLLKPFERSSRVLLTDLDVSMHMNNARYLSQIDLVRFEALYRSGLLRKIFRMKAVPLLGALDVRFGKELRRGDRFIVRMEVVYCDAKWCYWQYSFFKDDELCCLAIERAAVYQRGRGIVPMAEILAAMGLIDVPSQPPEYLLKWIETQDSMNQFTKVR